MAGQIPAQQRSANGMPTAAPTSAVTLESQRIDLPSRHASATPESQQRVEKKWTKTKKAKEQKGTKPTKLGCTRGLNPLVLGSLGNHVMNSSAVEQNASTGATYGNTGSSSTSSAGEASAMRTSSIS
jgi:hypothetical protein